MAAKYVHLTSLSQLSVLQNSCTVVVIDFHATWCGPCKTIAPVFEALAARHAAPGKIVFAKCDVDASQEVAQQYSVRAMPTFVIVKNRMEVDRVQGADRGALTAAVERHVRDIKPTNAFSNSKGHTLGSAPASSSAPFKRATPAYVRNGEVSQGLPISVSLGNIGNQIVRFLGLYIASFFSVDPIPSAAASSFAVGNIAGRGPTAPRTGRRLGTMN